MKKRNIIIIVCAICAALVLGAGAWYLLSDRQPPELTVLTEYKVPCGEAVTVAELVAYVSDRNSYEVTLSGDGTVSQDGTSITFSKTGTFPVLVEATDAKGNRTQREVMVTSEDKTPPELTVKTITTTVGKNIKYQSYVTAVDAVDGDLSESVQVNAIYVNTKEAGRYTALYSVADRSGNEAEAYGLVVVNPVKAKKLQLSQSELYLAGNQYATLTPVVTPKTWAGKVTWTSSDTSVATVSDGLVTWIAPGSCTITAKADKKKATCAVTCGGVAASSVRLSQSRMTLEEGTMTILQAETVPNNWSGEVTWKSSKPKVAKVKNGVVTALKPGKCTITAQAGEAKGVCTVTCTEKKLTTEWKEWWEDTTEGPTERQKAGEDTP